MSKEHLMIPCSELIHLSKDTMQLPLGTASISPPFSQIEMQELPWCCSVRSVAVTDKVSPWNYKDKAPGLPLGFPQLPWISACLVASFWVVFILHNVHGNLDDVGGNAFLKSQALKRGSQTSPIWQSDSFSQRHKRTFGSLKRTSQYILPLFFQYGIWIPFLSANLQCS